MSCIILVLENPYFAKADAKGRYTIANVPPGHYTLVAWQERLPMTPEIIVPETGDLAGVRFYPRHQKPAQVLNEHGAALGADRSSNSSQSAHSCGHRHGAFFAGHDVLVNTRIKAQLQNETKVLLSTAENQFTNALRADAES